MEHETLHIILSQDRTPH